MRPLRFEMHLTAEVAEVRKGNADDRERDFRKSNWVCYSSASRNSGPCAFWNLPTLSVFYFELIQSGLLAEKQKPLPLVYKEVKLDCGYRLDLLVENKVVMEVKAVEALNDVHMAQVLTYLKLSKCKLGLLMNFNVVLLKDGIKRIANLNDSALLCDLCRLNAFLTSEDAEFRRDRA